MERKSGIIALSLTAALLATPMAAQAQVGVTVRIAPPAPRYEAVPAPRRGYVWAPGHWVWRGGKWAWGSGRWLPARAGYHYAPGHWAHRGPGWHYVPGHWAR